MGHENNNESYKALFVAAPGIYLLNHSVGRPPVSTHDNWLSAFLEPWERGGDKVWPHWLEAIDGFRTALAGLLNGQRANFCPQVNLSSALTKILTSITPPESQRTIVYTEQDFPSMGFVLQQAQQNGYKLHAIPDTADTGHIEAWEQYLCPDAGIALITHVHSNTGKQVPVADICALARSKNIVSVVDIAQSVGVVPIDLGAWAADFVIGSCVKWLCGGPGAGFLWVDSGRLAQCEPTDVGWFSHEAPFEFDIHNFRYAADALRFWGGTPSVQPYVTAANSIRLMQEISVAKIREHNLALTQQIIDAVVQDVLVTPPGAQHRGGTVVLHHREQEQKRVCARLRSAGVDFDVRPTGIRLSPHIYNDVDEIEAVVEAL